MEKSNLRPLFSFLFIWVVFIALLIELPRLPQL